MIFAILDNNIYTLSNTHRMHVEKLSIGFVQIGYRVITITDLNCIKSLGPEDILYVSNHFQFLRYQYNLYMFLDFSSLCLQRKILVLESPLLVTLPICVYSQYAPFYFGGDGGIRTPVQNVFYNESFTT